MARLLPTLALGIAFTCGALAVPAAPHAQPAPAAVPSAGGTLAGRVTDTAGAPLPGANVVLEGTGRGAAADFDGRFVIAGVLPGAYTVVATVVGYRAERRAVVVGEGAVEVTFALGEAAADLGEVVVTARETLTGRGVRDVPGSAHYLGPEALARHAYADVHRVLREVPGVNVQEEDGYGLRPNVGLRGTGVERSSKITLMEDGVLMAPAPYAAPAAYYFPSVGRMDGVEVRTGASQIRYGPNTTGGAINLLAAEIPATLAVRADALLGENGQRALHLRAGTTWADLGGFGLGVVGEVRYDDATGFKALRAPGGEVLDGFNSGFDRADVFGRVRLQTAPGARRYQSLTFSAGYTDEVSNETYTGLTAEDYAARPFVRYAGSQLDEMDADHTALRLRHVAVLSSRLDLTTTAYRNTFDRVWYRLGDVRDGLADDVTVTNGDTTLSDRTIGIAAVLDDPARYAEEYATILGTNTAGRLNLRANDRSYYSQGVQTVAGLRLGAPRRGALVEVGLRVHGDAEERFQHVDRYRFEDGALVREQEGAPGTDANRIDRGRAVAGFAQAEVELGRLIVTPGLRVEHVTLSREDFGRADPERTGANVATRENTVTGVVPGLGVLYRATGAVEVFAGAHRGFAPPDSRDETRPESSLNLEGGLRYTAPALDLQLVGFYVDYANLLGSDFASSGGAGTGDQFNGGAVEVLGAEAALNADLARLAGVAGWGFPARLAYTYTRGTFQESFVSTFADWGTVEAGDALPYLAPHQLTAAVGVERGRVRADVLANYVAAMRAVAGRGEIPADEEIDGRLVVDLSAEVALPRGVALFGQVRNVFDETYLVARRPAGLRPGLPRTLAAGLRVRL